MTESADVVLPRLDAEELHRRLDPIRQALGADRLAILRRRPGDPRGGGAHEVLGQCTAEGPIDPPDRDLPRDFVARLLREGRGLSTGTDPATGVAAEPEAPARAPAGWTSGWALPTDRWPTVFVVAWSSNRPDPGRVRCHVAEAGMEALASALAPPAWYPFAPLRAPREDVPAEPDAREPEGSLRSALDRVERELLVHALRAAEGNKTRAAQRLCLSRQGLYRKLRHHGLIVTRDRTRQGRNP